MELRGIERHPVEKWIEEIRRRFPEPPEGPIVLTTSHIPSSLDLTSLEMIRRLGWKNPVTILLLDTVPPRVDYKAGFYGIHGYKEGMLYQHPPESFWNKKRPYFAIDEEEKRIELSHIHPRALHGQDIVEYHENLRKRLWEELGLKAETRRASEVVREVFGQFLEKYGTEGFRKLLNYLFNQYYTTPRGAVMGNAMRFVGGVGSAQEGKTRKWLLRIRATGDRQALERLREAVEEGKAYLKGELSLALLLATGHNHWGNNYLLDPFSLNEALLKLLGSEARGKQITDRFKDAWSIARIYLPYGGHTTSLSSLVNLLHHHERNVRTFIEERLRKGETVALVVPARLEKA